MTITCTSLVFDIRSTWSNRTTLLKLSIPPISLYFARASMTCFNLSLPSHFGALYTRPAMMDQHQLDLVRALRTTSFPTTRIAADGGAVLSLTHAKRRDEIEAFPMQRHRGAGVDVEPADEAAGLEPQRRGQAGVRDHGRGLIAIEHAGGRAEREVDRQWQVGYDVLAA